MIDLVEYIKACAVPYDDVDNNCLVTATAAFRGAPQTEKLLAWWTSLAPGYRVELSTGKKQIDLDDLFYSCGFSRGYAPTGFEIGAIKQLEIAPPIFVVGANGVWFARGVKRAVKVPTRLVVQAWSLAPCPK